MKSIGRIVFIFVAVIIVLGLIWMARGFLSNVWPSWWGWLVDKLP